MVLDARPFLRAFFVHEVNACGIRRITVGDEGQFLVGIGGADGFGHGDDSGQRFTGMREMVGGEDKIF